MSKRASDILKPIARRPRAPRVARGEGKHGDVDWWLIIERHQQLAAFLGQHGDKKGETRSDFVFAGQDLPNVLWKNTN